jgi:hypothetical protein
MAKIVRLAPEAEEEIAAGIDCYERQQPGLGAAFLAEIAAVMRELDRRGVRASHRRDDVVLAVRLPAPPLIPQRSPAAVPRARVSVASSSQVVPGCTHPSLTDSELSELDGDRWALGRLDPG